MIDKREILEFSREFGLNANVVEKDYVIGWVLWGISSHPDLGSSWVFKGGTCLKKCYFETYRFSEDLDFTLPGTDSLDEKFLSGVFNGIADSVYETTGIEIHKETIRFEVYENPRGGISAQGKIGYRGPMQKRGDLPRIKLDLTTDEVLVLDPQLREVHHPYSDRPEKGIRVRCYSFEEVFAEKMRALAERERPRDLYDVIHLYRHDELRPDRVLVLTTLEKKCLFKGVTLPSLATLENRPERIELENEWENMLAHQLPVLPPFEQFWQEIPLVFEWLHGVREKTEQSSVPRMGLSLDDTWQPPNMAQAWHTGVPLEIIRFAAANRLCVDLAYHGTNRLIEPYSLRRTREGNLLLFAIRHETGEVRSYRVDRIQGAEVKGEPFVPRYAIELTPTGPIAAPPTARRSNSHRTSVSRPIRSSRSRPRTRAPRSGPTYVIECSVCGKKFRRKTNKTRLNPHKDKNGYKCYGRSGYLVDVQ
ncbi:MAG: nucleotidyl transferase AbiEii/AbiGii toxin family protein [Deltaproteobacteria bacterium]|nr:nucleotidyl transferase AbiEii/AbiGii toxin family protein [Deltaproteobacteria bacterium]